MSSSTGITPSELKPLTVKGKPWSSLILIEAEKQLTGKKRKQYPLFFSRSGTAAKRLTGM